MSIISNVQNKIRTVITIHILSLLVLLPFLSLFFTPEDMSISSDIPDTCIAQYRSAGAIPSETNCVLKAVATNGGMGGVLLYR